MAQEDFFRGEEALTRQRGSETPSYIVFIFVSLLKDSIYVEAQIPHTYKITRVFKRLFLALV